MKFFAKSFLVVALALTSTVALAQKAGEIIPGKWLVGYDATQRAAVSILSADVEALGGKVSADIPIANAVAVEMSATAVEELRRNPAVLYVEPDRYVVAFGTLNPGPFLVGEVRPYGIDMVNAPAAWSVTKGSGAKVGLLDTGYDLNHEDMVNIAGSKSFVGGSVQDGAGHGTHTAGTIGGPENGVGVVGVAPQVSLYIGKVLSDSGGGSLSGIASGINWAAGQGVNVISMSLGGPSGSWTMETACNNARNAGVFVVAAAGNDNTSTKSYPAGYASVFAVMAIDQNKEKASFSNYGDWVDVAAPGVGTLSTVPMGTGGSANTIFSGANHDSNAIQGSQTGTVAASVYDCGLANGTGGSCPGAVSGNIALIQRGEISFADKVAHAEAAGAAGVIIYNNAPGNFNGTIGDATTALVAVSISQEDGLVLQGLGDGASATLSFEADNYSKYSGTSMACPHVAGVAALLMAAATGTVSVDQIEAALINTAEDLGSPGKDNTFGNGLVDANAALGYLGF